MTKAKERCRSDADDKFLPESFIAGKSVTAGRVRASGMGKRRAWVLLLIHVAIFAHLLHWQLRGRTLSPLEPSETMYSIRDGLINAGAILMALSTLSVLVVGRFFCGWACHLVALQDGCAWLLKKMGIHPRPLRSRFLWLVPLGAALVMFGMPVLFRLRNDLGPPQFSSGLVKEDFWATFPGFWVGFATFLVCGGLMVWLLGSKGFCTYACPYGGVFGVVDRFSPGRIRVNDSCKACGHCSAICTSNVAVADEVHRFGMVVDAGCMKCLDCVSVCPENALSFGFGKPAFLAKARKPGKKRQDFSLGVDLFMVLVFVVTLTVFAGLPDTFAPWATSLHGQTPLLFALGLAGVTAFAAGLVVTTLRSGSFAITGLRLRNAQGITTGGRGFIVVASLWFVFCLQAGFVQYQFFRAEAAFRAIDVPRWAWRRGEELPSEVAELTASAREHFAASRSLALFSDLRIPSRLAALAMVAGEPEVAIDEFRKATEIAPEHPETRAELASVLAFVGRFGDAAIEGEEAARLSPGEPRVRYAVMRWAIGAEDWQRARRMATQLIAIVPAEQALGLRLDLVGFDLNLGDVESARRGAQELTPLLPDDPRLKAYVEELGRR